MQTTPQANRLTVSIFGRTNSGKSSLFNAITDTDNAIVSAVPGTTTDPVSKAMELLPHGPIVLVDTAGLGDVGTLGDARMKKTAGVLNRTDFALYAIDPADPGWGEFEFYAAEFKKRDIPFLPLVTKRDTADPALFAGIQKKLPGAKWVSANSEEDIEALKTWLAKELDALQEDHPLLGGLLPAGSVAVLVVPVDSEAPKGRLILPQVQLIRECLDAGVRCHVTTEKDLPAALAELKKVDLVATDSQAFKLVDSIVPPEVPLTSFSILMARQKGDIASLTAGAKALEGLQDGDNILIAETCTHNRSHEDIGRVKLPKLIQQKTGKTLHFDFVAGRDYPDDLARYKAVLHCGGCMITRKEMQNRQRIAAENGVPITNYGMALAWANGILDRSMEILHKPK